MQICDFSGFSLVGGYGVLAVACVVDRRIFLFVTTCTLACSGYGGDAIASYCLVLILLIVLFHVLA